MRTLRLVPLASSRNWVKMLLCAVLVAVFALAFGAQGVSAQTPTYETGNVCISRYITPANCTAEDVRIKTITPNIADLCVGAGDSVTANFQAEILTGATTRYDIGMFIGLGGGSALTGTNCYHDFLQKPIAAGVTWNPAFLSTGLGPFRNQDGDYCADTLQNDGSVFYNFQVPVTVACVDTNTDGIADPFSTCTSWDNNANTTCDNVTQAVPGTPAKCWCGDITSTPPIIYYSGADYGDLPDIYGTTLGANGPRHAVQDPTNDGTPNSITITTTVPATIVPAIYLGTAIDYSPAPNGESNGQPSDNAMGDDNGAPGDDEDGVSRVGAWSLGGNTQFSVNVGSTTGTCSGCQVGYWFDWNNDGDFGDTNESGTAGVAAGSNTIGVPTPAIVADVVYARFRLYSGTYTGAISPLGEVANGEVEDYRFLTPTAVDLISLSAAGTDETVVLNWETAAETDTLGFNVYRAVRVNGPRMKLNEALVPSLVAPGSAFGAVYEYVDTNVPRARRIPYYYWLESVNIFGGTQLYGPVKAAAVWGR